jgi:hypothetical protein
MPKVRVREGFTVYLGEDRVYGALVEFEVSFTELALIAHQVEVLEKPNKRGKDDEVQG